MESAEFEKHEQLEAAHWWFEGRRRCIAGVLDAHLRPHPARRILDVGCGTGGMFPLLQRYGSVSGAEYSGDARARAARRFPSVSVSPCNLPREVPEGSFNLVTAFDVVEHLDEPIAALRTLRSRLAPGGQLVVTVPAFQALWSQHDVSLHHRRRYSRALLSRHLQCAGFRLTYDSFFNTTLFPIVAVTRVAQRLLQQLRVGRANGHGAAPARETDLEAVTPVVNKALTTLFGAEAKALSSGRLPFGVSLIAVAHPA